jgi:hypothetical protein
MKRTVLILCGLCWLGFAAGFGLFTLAYLKGGAGLQFLGLGFSSGSVLIGWVHFIGLCLATLFAFAIGTGLFLHGLVPARKES